MNAFPPEDLSAVVRRLSEIPVTRTWPHCPHDNGGVRSSPWKNTIRPDFWNTTGRVPGSGFWMIFNAIDDLILLPHLENLFGLLSLSIDSRRAHECLRTGPIPKAQLHQRVLGQNQRIGNWPWFCPLFQLSCQNPTLTTQRQCRRIRAQTFKQISCSFGMIVCQPNQRKRP